MFIFRFFKFSVSCDQVLFVFFQMKLILLLFVNTGPMRRLTQIKLLDQDNNNK